jgi:hypothetical protein
METIRLREKTGPDGTLSLRLPLGPPEAEYEVVVVVQPAQPEPATAGGSGWPPGYFALAGSVSDETFLRPPQGALPKPVALE